MRPKLYEKKTAADLMIIIQTTRDFLLPLYILGEAEAGNGQPGTACRYSVANMNCQMRPQYGLLASCQCDIEEIRGNRR